MQFDPFNRDLNLAYCRASTQKRFANHVIDVLVFYVALFVGGIVIEIIYPGLLDGINGLLLIRLIGMVCYSLFMCFIEAVSRGKSIGKLITGTKAVNSDGTEIDFPKAFLRNIIRAVPFNELSALGNPCEPWHDRWSNTIVIEEKKLALQKQRTDLFESVKNQTL
ncbi:RDD family protein [Pedobacter sp. HDW13]|uniref:RDD family protein n=1 Tax=unclassified Pedobacter TaxID=2628915 RepID=UPI0014081673|nr:MULTISPECIES: RDD family protein [unclassified Pedobacter]QIL39604.1 RDD family protein [Pedobacter sp. HDW13]